MENKELYKNKKWLEEKLYEYRSLKDIANICEVTSTTIRNYIKKHGIELEDDFYRKNKFDKMFFKKIDNEIKAYWLGFIMADGSIASKGNGYYALTIVLKNTDINHLQSFKKDINGTFKIIERELNDKRGFTSKNCTMSLTSVELVEDLSKFNICPNKTGKEIIPEINEDLKRHFIRGYFDGDGSITKAGAFRICSASKVILEQINKHFKKHIGIEFTIYCDKKYKNGFYTIDSRHKGKNKLALEYLYNNCSRKLDRKYERFLNIIVGPLTH